VDGCTKIGIAIRKFMNGPAKAILNEVILKQQMHTAYTYGADSDYNALLENEIFEKIVDHEPVLIHECKR
jgi:hypothetical protein